MQKFEITINGGTRMVLASNPAIAIRQVLGEYRQTVVPTKLKSGDTVTMTVTLTRLPYARPKSEPRPKPVDRIRVGDVRWAPQGLVRVIGKEGDMWKVCVIGDENRVGDTMVDDSGQAMGTITNLTPGGCPSGQ